MGLTIKHKNAKKSSATGVKKKVARRSATADLSNDPFFVKKAESAKKLLGKYGLPK